MVPKFQTQKMGYQGPGASLIEITCSRSHIYIYMKTIYMEKLFEHTIHYSMQLWTLCYVFCYTIYLWDRTYSWQFKQWPGRHNQMCCVASRELQKDNSHKKKTCYQILIPNPIYYWSSQLSN